MRGAMKSENSTTVRDNQTMSELKNTPPEDAVIVVQLTKMQKAKKANASSQGEMRSIYSRAEERGVNLTAAKSALKIMESESEEKVQDLVQNMVDTIRYLALVGYNLTKAQLELFSFSPQAPQPLDEKAYEDGLRAGRRGIGIGDNPHDLNTESGKNWARGNEIGAEERRLVLRMEQPEDGATLVKRPQTDGDGGDGDDDFGDAVSRAGDEDE